MQDRLRDRRGRPALERPDNDAMISEPHDAEGSPVKRRFRSPLNAAVGWRTGRHGSDCSRRKLSALNVTVAAPAIAKAKRVVRLNMTGFCEAHIRNGPNTSTSTARTACVFRARPAMMPTSAPTTTPQPMHRTRGPSIHCRPRRRIPDGSANQRCIFAIRLAPARLPARPNRRPLHQHQV